MTFDMNDAGIRISVVGNDLDVRSDRRLTAPQFNFIKLHKARLLAELSSGSLQLVDILSRIGSDKTLTEIDSEAIDSEFFINSACQGLPVNSDWVHQYVVDDHDIEDIILGNLPQSCLRAHIEYHLEEQLRWKEFKQRTIQYRPEKLYVND